jgi:myo-inositol catabolism protein IolC
VTSFFVFAIDHRNSFRRWLATLDFSPQEIAEVAPPTKGVALDGLVVARSELRPDERAMLLIDDEYGRVAIERASVLGVSTVVPVERSGQSELIFEHGGSYWERFRDTGSRNVKVLIRYNPEGDSAANKRGRLRLEELAQRAEADGVDVMLELLVPPTVRQLAACGGSEDRYDETLRPDLVLRAMEEIAGVGVRPRWWKVEGYRDIAVAGRIAQLGTQISRAGCLVLGRGADPALVKEWVQVAALTGGFAGFAVGRTIWTAPLGEFLTGRIDREDAVARIASGYLAIAEAFRDALPLNSAEVTRDKYGR